MIQLEHGYILIYTSLLTEIPFHFAPAGMITGLSLLIIFLIFSTLLTVSAAGLHHFTQENPEKLRTGSQKNSGLILKLYDEPDKLFGTINAASAILNVIIAIVALLTASMIWDIYSCNYTCYLIEGAIILLLIVIFSYVLPLIFTTEMNKSIALFMAVPLTILQKVLKPLTSLPLFSSPELKKRTGTFLRSGLPFDDITDGMQHSSDEYNEDEKIFEGIINFGNTSAITIMCPRIDVTALDIRSEFNHVIQVIINSGFSRIPVYEITFDNIKGILYAKDILPFMSNPGDFKWQSLLREPYFVPETKKINDLLKEFQVKKIHMAVVIDEYGGTSGIVTLEDILEEIVGEITDESDDDEVLYRKIDETSFVFEGRILLNDLIKILNLSSDIFADVRGESETLAGLILEITGEIPEQGQSINYKNITFRIESADGRRIKKIRVEITSANDKPEEN